jgi:hypothetical protein
MLMRKLSIVPILLMVALAIVSCATGPKGELQEREGGAEPLVVDHKNKALGGAVPDWVFENVIDIEKRYPDSYVFKFEQEGKDKDGTMTFLAGMQAPTEVARQVSLRVTNKFVGAEVGDKDKVEVYMENVTKTLAEATITGLRQVDNYWIKLQVGRQQPYYRALALYMVPKAEIDSAIARALEAEAARVAPASDNERTARERVQAVFREEGIQGADIK